MSIGRSRQWIFKSAQGRYANRLTPRSRARAEVAEHSCTMPLRATVRDGDEIARANLRIEPGIYGIEIVAGIAEASRQFFRCADQPRLAGDCRYFFAPLS